MNTSFLGFTALLLSFTATSSFAISLQDYAKKTAPVVETVKKLQTATPNLYERDQVNNFKVGETTLSLSAQDLDDLDGISTLMVTYNKKKVPISSVKQLHLFINRNNISKIPDEIGELKNVKFLYLNRNKLSEAPEAIKNMTGLEGLYFSNNQFTEIPDFIFDMNFLRKLEFDGNKLQSISPRIGNLTNLIHARFGENRLRSLPGTFGKLQLLRVFDVSENQITTLEKGFEKINVEYILRLNGNPISKLPDALFNIRGNIDITGTNIKASAYSKEQQAKFGAEKKDPRKGGKARK